MQERLQMSRVLIVGGGAAGMLASILPQGGDRRFMYMRKMRSWERSFILQEKDGAT